MTLTAIVADRDSMTCSWEEVEFKFDAMQTRTMLPPLLCRLLVVPRTSCFCNAISSRQGIVVPPSIFLSRSKDVIVIVRHRLVFHQ
jgi:hypothetical protein